MEIPAHGQQLDRDLAIALEAASLAGQIIKDGYFQTHTIDEKGIGDLVCDIDRKADEVISQILIKHFPADTIISEELNSDTKPTMNRTWIVDPLDGTAGFLLRGGMQIPAVLIALQEERETKVGVVLFPLTGEWFYAVKNKGAFKDGEALKMNKAEISLKEAWIDMNHYGDVRYESQVFRGLREALRSPGGACVVTTPLPHSGVAMRIIEGESKLSAVIHDNDPTKVKQAAWDVAAPQLIVEEAGGVVWDLHGARYEAFSAQPFVVASSAKLAQEIVNLAKPLWN